MHMKKLFFSGRLNAAMWLFIPVIMQIFYSCNKHSDNYKNHYLNDLESYEGWSGISGYYLNSKDAHSGMHSFETNSTTAVYSITLMRKLSELSKAPIRKIEMSIWVKLSEMTSKGAYILSLDHEGKSLAYFSFAAEDFAVSTDKWYRIKGVAELPKNVNPDAVAKIYFWNKGSSTILVDDLEFTVVN